MSSSPSSSRVALRNRVRISCRISENENWVATNRSNTIPIRFCCRFWGGKEWLISVQRISIRPANPRGRRSLARWTLMIFPFPARKYGRRAKQPTKIGCDTNGTLVWWKIRRESARWRMDLHHRGWISDWSQWQDWGEGGGSLADGFITTAGNLVSFLHTRNTHAYIYTHTPLPITSLDTTDFPVTKIHSSPPTSLDLFLRLLERGRDTFAIGVYIYIYIYISW